MPIDFAFQTSPGYRVACLPPTSRYRESRVRADFERIERWIRDQGGRTGKWFFLFRDRPSDDRFQLAIEVKGSVQAGGEIRVRRIPAGKVGSITFDPDTVSPRVVFFGISAWLRWERRTKTIRQLVRYREVYDANPWTDRRAWSRTTVQVVVR